LPSAANKIVFEKKSEEGLKAMLIKKVLSARSIPNK